MRACGSVRPVGLAIVLALGALAAALYRENAGIGAGGRIAVPRAGHLPGGRPRVDVSKVPVASKWVELKDGRMEDDPNNDGDSFLIGHGGAAHIFRLYSVDCCEKRRIERNRPRLADQGAYFGGLDETAVIRLGRQARDEVKVLLTEHRFTVFTRWEPVFEDRRHYAHVLVRGGDGGRDFWLAEWLVERGLARIYTKPAALPDGTREAVVVQNLRRIESVAKAAGRGGWSVRAASRRD